MAFDKNNPKNRKRRKVCQFCVDKATFIDYKDTAKLRRFVSERSKILPRRTTGVCAMHQRERTDAMGKPTFEVAELQEMQNPMDFIEKTKNQYEHLGQQGKNLMPARSPNISCQPSCHELIAAVVHVRGQDQHKRRK